MYPVYGGIMETKDKKSQLTVLGAKITVISNNNTVKLLCEIE